MNTQHLKRVAVIGPECTGKSALSSFLAAEFQTNWVPEFAREYLNNLARPYEKEDLLEIAKGQLALEDKMAETSNELLVCDTNLYVIKIWSVVKYQHCDDKILDLIQRRKYDLYLLTFVDIPWEEDPLREHPEFREKLYKIYLKELKSQPVPFIEIRGERAQRQKTATEAIAKLLQKTAPNNLTGDHE